MKLLVCISKVPDTTTKITFTDNQTKFNNNGVQYIVNPYDEWYALVRALELKETLGGSVTTITVGTAEDDAIIRKALALGADDAVRIDAEPTEAYFVAQQIANYAKTQNFDIIFAGKETIDFNGSEVPSMLAAFMDLPFVSQASKLDVEANKKARVERTIEGGVEVVEVNLPFIVSAAKGMAEARIPNMRGIMAARTKALNVIAPSTDKQTLTQIKTYDLPKEKTACKYIDPDKAGELITLLHTEAKVI